MVFANTLSDHTNHLFTSSTSSIAVLATAAIHLGDQHQKHNAAAEPSFSSSNSSIVSTLSMVFTFLMLLMCAAGAVMNTLSLLIFTSREFRRRSINVLLAGLSASDLCLCLLAIPVFSLNQLQSESSGGWLFDPLVTARILVYAYPVTLMAQTMSVWMLVSITVDRYLAVCHPFSVRIHCTVKRALQTVALIFLFSVGYNVIRFWEYAINDTEGIDESERIVGLLRENPYYMVIYQNIALLLTQFVLPLLVLCVLNLHVARAILHASETRRELVASEKREHSTAKMMLFVVLVFIFCYMLSFCLNVLEIFHPDLFKQPVGFLLNDVNNVLVVLNSSSSFLFYIKYSSRYRTQLRRMRVQLHRLSCWWTRFCFCLCDDFCAFVGDEEGGGMGGGSGNPTLRGYRDDATAANSYLITSAGLYSQLNNNNTKERQNGTTITTTSNGRSHSHPHSGLVANYANSTSYKQPSRRQRAGSEFFRPISYGPQCLRSTQASMPGSKAMTTRHGSMLKFPSSLLATLVANGSNAEEGDRRRSTLGTFSTLAGSSAHDSEISSIFTRLKTILLKRWRRNERREEEEEEEDYRDRI